jgi:speckle-type POZ protein
VNQYFLQAMLHFIYRDTLVDDNELVASSSDGSVFDTLAAKLLAAADKYDLARLRLLCESCLCKGITVASVASTLALADRHHAVELKAVCLKFAAENLSGTSYQCIPVLSLLILYAESEFAFLLQETSTLPM